MVFDVQIQTSAQTNLARTRPAVSIFEEDIAVIVNLDTPEKTVKTVRNEFDKYEFFNLKRIRGPQIKVIPILFV